MHPVLTTALCSLRRVFIGDRQEVLEALRAMGSRVCSYGKREWPAGRCDCKYGVDAGRWPTASESGCGCPELASVFEVVSAISDEEWLVLVARGGNAPSGAALLAPGLMGALRDADHLAQQAQEAVAACRAELAERVLGGGRA